MKRACVLGAVVVALVACKTSESGESGGSPRACDPLAPPATTLMPTIQAAKDAQGTFYVVDSFSATSPDEARLFVSSGATLVRQHVTGSGYDGSGHAILDFQAPDEADAQAMQILEIDLQGSGVAAMSVGGNPDPGSKLPSNGTPLTLVDASSVQSMTIANLPGVPRYVADVNDGTALVVTSPMDDLAAEHLFYGTPDAMIERTITGRSQSGSGYPAWTFAVGSAQYTASISGTGCCVIGDGGAPVSLPPGPGTLDTGTATIGFTVRTPTPRTLGEFAFTCTR